jgi:uncharacterized DUF497 family protein
MEFEWDEAKRCANLAKHGLDFSDLDEFDWDHARRTVDDRKDYGEVRIVAMSRFQGRVHIVVYTKRGGRTRIIGFRKANDQETRVYEEEERLRQP